MVHALKECRLPSGVQVAAFSSFAHYIYSTHCKVTGGRLYWYEGKRGPVAMTGEVMRKIGLQGPRNSAMNCYKVGPYASCDDVKKIVLPPGAWHLSSCLMNETSVIKKMNSNVDRVSQVPTFAEVRNHQEQCEDPRGFYEMELLKEPATTYPAVPHALQEQPVMFQRISGKWQ
mmetsp:Transcript_9149/g.20827  ORF Transcript_9149/g.20827 Transcript_9149/m.20827 type:complete len:173 (-) Transcript_9149:49-567(-)